jgi:hypothetical protein
MTLNTNYKIPDETLRTLGIAITKLGFKDAFDIALDKLLCEITKDGKSILITEYLSWSHNLSKKVSVTKDPLLCQKYSEAAAFYRKLAHHAYWAARRAEIIEHNPNFIQVA